MSISGESYAQLLLEASDLYRQASRLYGDQAHVRLNGYVEINVLLRRAEVVLKLAELSDRR